MMYLYPMTQIVAVAELESNKSIFRKIDLFSGKTTKCLEKIKHFLEKRGRKK